MDPTKTQNRCDDPFEDELIEMATLRIGQSSIYRRMGQLENAEQMLRYAIAEFGDAIKKLGNAPSQGAQAVAALMEIPVPKVQSISRELDAKLLIWREPYALGLLGALNHLAVSEDEWTSANGLVEKLVLDTGLSAIDIRIGVMSGILYNLIEWRNPSKSPLEVNDVQLMGLEEVRLSQIGAQYMIDNLGD